MISSLVWMLGYGHELRTQVRAEACKSGPSVSALPRKSGRLAEVSPSSGRAPPLSPQLHLFGQAYLKCLVGEKVWIWVL